MIETHFSPTVFAVNAVRRKLKLAKKQSPRKTTKFRFSEDDDNHASAVAAASVFTGEEDIVSLKVNTRDCKRI
jgi:hypothetical protein